MNEQKMCEVGFKVILPSPLPSVGVMIPKFTCQPQSFASLATKHLESFIHRGSPLSNMYGYCRWYHIWKRYIYYNSTGIRCTPTIYHWIFRIDLVMCWPQSTLSTMKQFHVIKSSSPLFNIWHHLIVYGIWWHLLFKIHNAIIICWECKERLRSHQPLMLAWMKDASSWLQCWAHM